MKIKELYYFKNSMLIIVLTNNEQFMLDIQLKKFTEHTTSFLNQNFLVKTLNKKDLKEINTSFNTLNIYTRPDMLFKLKRFFRIKYILLSCK